MRHAERGEAPLRLLPVIEIFGPTVQGEGPSAGQPSYFVRFGGCDYRCTWCDSLYAVEPSEVRANAESLSPTQVVQRLQALPDGPELVVLSGGNPALLDLRELVEQLHEHECTVAVETQGSRWRDWLASVDQLIVSPKAPSSGMAGDSEVSAFDEFMATAASFGASPVLKIVVFDETDLGWAESVHLRYPGYPLFLSVGTDVGLKDEETLSRLRHRFRHLATQVARRPSLADARISPQLHVIAWGTARGV